VDIKPMFKLSRGLRVAVKVLEFMQIDSDSIITMDCMVIFISGFRW
jgi:hypothetical protein